MMTNDEIVKILQANKYYFGKSISPLQWYFNEKSRFFFLRVLAENDTADDIINVILSPDVALLVARSYKFRWIKLSEAKPEELPVDFERIEILTDDSQSRQDGMYNPSVAMYRFENNQHTFYPMFTWAVVEMVLEDPEQARKIYGDKLNLSVKNVIYFRHINREDLPEYIPRERRKVDF